MDGYLSHHGIKGQKWGVRRYQNEDGSYTNAGKNRYSAKSNWKGPDTFKYRRMNRLADRGDALRAKGETITSNSTKRYLQGLTIGLAGIMAGNYLNATNQVLAIHAGQYVAKLDGNMIRAGALIADGILTYTGGPKRRAINASYMRDRATKNRPNWAGKSNYILPD